MRLKIIEVPRRPPWPWWAVALVLVWAGLGAAAIGLSQLAHRQVHLCLFKRLTGVPCPTCGATRALMLLSAGRIAAAWQMNPGLLSVMFLLLLALLARLCLGRAVKVRLGRVERRAAWAIAIALFALNWAYVILWVG